jgi:glycerophosphoryl diester phosphodiesterase
MVTPDGLKQVADYADGIGPQKDMVIPRKPDGTLATPTRLAADARSAGLGVHPWTFRAENVFLPTDLRSSEDPRAKGDLASEIRAFVKAGVTGLFSDNVPEARAALKRR